MTVNKSVHVKRSSEDAFRLFVNEIGKWWPLRTNRFTYGGDRAQDIFLEEPVGGRFYERFKDGEEFVIGHEMTCDRPDRIVFTWRAASRPRPRWTYGSAAPETARRSLWSIAASSRWHARHVHGTPAGTKCLATTCELPSRLSYGSASVQHSGTTHWRDPALTTGSAARQQRSAW